MEDLNAKVIKQKLPPYIDEAWLKDLQARAAESRKAELLALKILGYEESEELNQSFIRELMNFPPIDCEDAIFDRHAPYDDGEPDVSR